MAFCPCLNGMFGPKSAPYPEKPPPDNKINTKEKWITVIGLHDFTANSPDELSFSSGDLLKVIESKSNWLQATNQRTNASGLIPANYITRDSGVSGVLDAYYEIQRMEAEKKLIMPGVEPGTYIVRPSKDDSMGYCLSVLFKSGDKKDVQHFRIKYNERMAMYYMSPSKHFGSLEQLVDYYKSTALSDGIVLTVPRPRVVPPPWHFKDCILDRSLVVKERKLGQGNFGEVYLARIKSVPVAIKMSLNPMNREEFIKEAQIMYTLSHPRLVRFLGICSKPEDEPIYIITEYMENGSLKDYLTKCDKQSLEYLDLVFIIYQVCDGMAYLESLDFVHRDLRAANVLVALDLTVKVADFGLTRTADVQGNVAVDDSQLPIRWTAPESFSKSAIITSKADVWSFGVLMFEVLTYGSTPFADLKINEVKGAIMAGRRLPDPKHLGFGCTQNIFNLMTSCWHVDPERRPEFKASQDMLENFINENEGGYDLHGETEY